MKPLTSISCGFLVSLDLYHGSPLNKRSSNLAFTGAAATFADSHLLHRLLENKLEGKIVAVWGLKERF